MLPKWKTAVNDTYGSSSDGLDYINGLPSPTRKEYKKLIMRKREILSSLSEVILFFLLKPSQEDPVYNAYERDIAVVNIFFGQTTAFGNFFLAKLFIPSLFLKEFSRSEKMTWFDFAANMGGITGVTLGISFVSVIELFYWVSIKFCKNLTAYKE